MRRMHCPCWNFPGLEQAFEFSDIFGLVAPRRLLLENGLKEPVEKPGEPNVLKFMAKTTDFVLKMVTHRGLSDSNCESLLRCRPGGL